MATTIIEVILILFIAGIVGVVILFALESGFERGYKAGQIDAVKGEIKIVLIEFEDGRREWFTSEEVKNLRPGNYKFISLT